MPFSGISMNIMFYQCSIRAVSLLINDLPPIVIGPYCISLKSIFRVVAGDLDLIASCIVFIHVVPG